MRFLILSSIITVGLSTLSACKTSGSSLNDADSSEPSGAASQVTTAFVCLTPTERYSGLVDLATLDRPRATRLERRIGNDPWSVSYYEEYADRVEIDAATLTIVYGNLQDLAYVLTLPRDALVQASSRSLKVSADTTYWRHEQHEPTLGKAECTLALARSENL